MSNKIERTRYLRAALIGVTATISVTKPYIYDEAHEVLMQAPLLASAKNPREMWAVESYKHSSDIRRIMDIILTSYEYHVALSKNNNTNH